MKIEIEHEGSTPVNVGRRKVVSFARRLTRRHLRRGVRGVGHVRVGWRCFPEIGGPRSGEPHSGGPQQGEPPQAAPSAQTCAPVPASAAAPSTGRSSRRPDLQAALRGAGAARPACGRPPGLPVAATKPGRRLSRRATIRKAPWPCAGRCRLGAPGYYADGVGVHAQIIRLFPPGGVMVGALP